MLYFLYSGGVSADFELHTPMVKRVQILIYESLLSLVKARKILQQNFDQDAVGDLVWCGNMNWKNIAGYIPHRLARQGNRVLKSALH